MCLGAVQRGISLFSYTNYFVLFLFPCVCFAVFYIYFFSERKPDHFRLVSPSDEDEKNTSDRVHTDSHVNYPQAVENRKRVEYCFFSAAFINTYPHYTIAVTLKTGLITIKHLRDKRPHFCFAIRLSVQILSKTKKSPGDKHILSDGLAAGAFQPISCLLCERTFFPIQLP